ncbi:MAG: IS21 family transposase [Acidobacteria bacterium]|nr:IS21 family transposase [Acidobacteriota bacterium]
MLKWEEQMDIKFLVGQGHSIRQVAKLSGHARNTVRSVIRPRENQPQRESRGRKSKLTDFKEYLRARYLETGLSGVRLCEEIAAMGFTGSVSAVRRFLQTIEKGGISPKATVRFETPPGEQAQVDWAEIGYFLDENGIKRKIYAFLMVLSFSRMLFIEFVTDISTETLIACHQKAFAYFGGYTRRILYDNMKQVRLSQTEWNPLFQDFLGHYGIIGNTHRPYRARTKGKVERAVLYLRDSFIKGRAFENLADLQTQCLVWQETVANCRVHATTREKPSELFKSEQLISLRQVAEYRLVSKASRKVSAEGFVHFAGSRYSVAPQAVGKTVLIEQDEQLLRVKSDDLIIAEHQVSARKNADVIDPEHLTEMWKLSLGKTPVPNSRKLQVMFNDEVAMTPLQRYEEVIG